MCAIEDDREEQEQEPERQGSREVQVKVKEFAFGSARRACQPLLESLLGPAGRREL